MGVGAHSRPTLGENVVADEFAPDARRQRGHAPSADVVGGVIGDVAGSTA